MSRVSPVDVGPSCRGPAALKFDGVEAPSLAGVPVPAVTAPPSTRAMMLSEMDLRTPRASISFFNSERAAAGVDGGDSNSTTV